MRGRMRAEEIKSYTPAFPLNKPISSYGVGRVVKSANSNYKKGQELYGFFDFVEYQILGAESLKTLTNLAPYQEGIPATQFVGAMGMPGKTAGWGEDFALV